MPQKPVKNGYITSEYGPRTLNGSKEFHPGIDIGSKDTEPIVYCAISGTVVAAGWSNPANKKESFGLRVWVCCGEGLYVVYGHLSKINDDIKPGLKINEGNPIGIMGNTGRSFGKHLHYEHRTLPNVKGTHINPEIIRKLYV